MKFITSKPSVALVVTLVALLSYMSACTKETAPSDTMDASGQSSLLSFEGKPLKTVNFTSQEPSPNLLSSISTQVSKEDISTVMNSFKARFGGELFEDANNILSVVAYTTGSNKVLALNEIKGISMLIRSSSGDYHRFYKISNGLAVEEKRFSAYFLSSDFARQSLDIIGKTVLGKAIKYVVLHNQTPVNKNSFGSKSTSTANISSLYSNLEIQVINTTNETYSSNCEYLVCGSTQESAHCGYEYPPDGSPAIPICITDVCSSNVANNIIESQNSQARLSENGSKQLSSLNIDLGHSFRDNFLLKRKRGQEYVAAYYKIGQFAFLRNMLAVGNTQKHIQLLEKAYACANVIQNGNNNDIAVSEEFKNEALSMIAEYRKILGNDPEYKIIFDKLNQDFIRFAGKPRSQVLATL